jgi:hypothetical protein
VPPQSDLGRWTALLDALEQAIADREQARRDVTAPPPAPQLPAHPGPIPAPLEARARRVLDALAEQEASFAAALDVIRGELARVTRPVAIAPRSVVGAHRGAFEARV